MSRHEEIARGLRAEIAAGRYGTAGRLPGEAQRVKRFDVSWPTAALLMRSLHQLKVSVPDTVRVTGFDDVKFATLVSPSLTTMQQPCRDIAIAAFHAMVERLAHPMLPPRKISLAPRLIVRDSCGAYLAAKPARR